MKILIAFLLLIMMNFVCIAQNKDYKNKKMTYDKNLCKFNLINLKNKKVKVCNKLNYRLNLYLSEENKIETDKIEFNDTILSKILKGINEEFDLFGYCYGQKIILNNKLMFYSENLKNDNISNNIVNIKNTGILLIESNGIFKNWLKVYESEIDSYYFLESFLFDNYIFLIQTNDSGYDVYYPGKEKKIKYKYLVFEILQDGVIRKIIESKAKKIKNKYLDKK